MEKKLRIENLKMTYDKDLILDDISFDVNKGEFISIVGKSGVGKSTLLRCLNLLNKPEGKIFFNEENILNLKGRKLREVRSKIAFIFQDYNVLDNLYVIDNVLAPRLAKKNFFQVLFSNYKKEDYDKALNYLDKVGLKDEAFKKTKYLSGGQKQRVAIAKALCQNPEIVLADEPVSSLDEKNTLEVMNLFKKLNDKKEITLIINLHDINIAKKYSDKIIGIKDKKILFYKRASEVTDEEFKELYL